MSRRSSIVKLSSLLSSAGKRETGMWTSPKRMAPFQSSRGICGFSWGSAAGRRGVHQARHAHRRTGDFLAARDPAGELARRERHSPPGLRGPVEGADHADVREAFLAVGLGLAAAEDAIAEVLELRGE